MFRRQAGKGTKCTPRKRNSAVWREWKTLSSLITQRYKPKGTRESLTWPAQREKGKNPVCTRCDLPQMAWKVKAFKRKRSFDSEWSKTVKTYWCPSGTTIFAMATPTCIGRWGQEGPFVSPLPSSTLSQAQAYHWKQNIGKNSSAQTDCANKQDPENQGDY